MATIINNPGGNQTPNDNSAAGIIVGIILALVIIGAAIVLWPKIRAANTVVVPAPAANQPSNTNIKVNLPNPTPVNPSNGAGSGSNNPPTSGSTQ